LNDAFERLVGRPPSHERARTLPWDALGWPCVC
jgi:hypothetical protein